jgi:hypothetical protein
MREAIELLEKIKKDFKKKFGKTKDEEETFKNVIDEVKKIIKVFFEKEKRPLPRGTLAGTFYILWQRNSLSEITIKEIAEIFGLKNEASVMHGALHAKEVVEIYFNQMSEGSSKSRFFI